MDQEILSLQQDGANARALGRSAIDNPFYKSDAMPGHTGEPVEQWNRKMEAWNLGWTIEDMMRPSNIAAAFRSLPIGEARSGRSASAYAPHIGPSGSG